jgi:glutamate carboxypeptidase
MKGGIVQAIFALDALRELGMQPSVTPLLFLNSDEETGSKASAGKIRRLARIVDRALVLEPSLGAVGQLKTSRKGVGRYRITVLGKAAHAGLDPEKGVSAILELTHVIQALFAMNDPIRGITVNVGTIDGGLRPNVVAPESRAEVDVRVRTQHDADAIDRAIRAIQPTVPGTALRIEGGIGRPPLEPNARNRSLWDRALASSSLLGFDLQEGSAGGGSDGNWTSLYTPTLDGLGAVGDGAHAAHEHVVEELMPQRAALLACMILEGPLASIHPNSKRSAATEMVGNES